MSGTYNSHRFSAASTGSSHNNHNNGSRGHVYTQFSNPYSSTPPSFESVLKNLAKTGNIPTMAVVQSLQGYLSTSYSSTSSPRATSSSSSPSDNNNNGNVEWTLDLAQTLSNYTIHLLTTHLGGRASPTTTNTNDEIPTSISATLFLLVSAMEQWEDDLVYAILVQKHGKKNLSLLDVLHEVAVEGHAIHTTAILGLSVAWNVLDRLQQYTTLVDFGTTQRLDTPWWIPRTFNVNKLTSTLVSHLCGSQAPHNDIGVSSGMFKYPFPQKEQLKLSCASLLCSIIKHDSSDWFHAMPNDQILALCQRLLVETQRLNNPDLASNAPQYTLPFSLRATCLLSLIQWKHDIELREYETTIHTTQLVENVIKFTFSQGPNCPNHSPGGGNGVCSPLWINASYEARQLHMLRSIGQDLVYIWSICGGAAWSVVDKQDRRWRDYLECFWKEILNRPSYYTSDVLNGIKLLHTIRRLTARSILFSVLHGHSDSNRLDEYLVDPCRRLLTLLFELCQSSSMSVRMSSSSLVFSLLSDRRSESTHDDISRALWTALKDDTLIKSFVATTIESASTDDLKQPEILSYLNILDNQINHSSVDQRTGHLHSLGAKNIEKLIHLVTPKNLRIDFMDPNERLGFGCFDASIDKEETPPTNNLSRLDEKSICVEHEEEKEPCGFDNSVRVTAATVLARLGYCKLEATDESIRLLQSRICSAVNNFITSYLEGNNYVPSLDMNMRLFRLEMTVATPENEEFVAVLRFTKQQMVHKQIAMHQEEMDAYQQKLEDSRKREKRLEVEKKALHQQQQARTLLFQREISRAQKNAEQDSRQLVGIHVSERAKAETRALELSKQTNEASRLLDEANTRVEACQAAEVAAKEQLEKSSSRIAALNEEVETLKRECAEQEAKAVEFEGELKTTTTELEAKERDFRELEEEIHSRDDQISDSEQANQQLRANLEDLFADMVSLAQIFQAKEKDEAEEKGKTNEKIQEVTSQLDVERRRAQELQETEKKLRNENERLYEKAKKYKKLLEAELENKRAAEKRKQHAPVSYINQLHTSGVSDKSSSRTSRSSSRSESQSGYRSVSRQGKENDASSSSSAYRKRYY